MLVVCILAGARPTAAAEFDGGIPGSFLELGSGAREFAMGGAFGAIAEGPEAVFWNPGGLGRPFSDGASFTHINLFEGASVDALSYAHAFDRPIGIGASMISLSNGGFVQRDSFNNETGSFDDNRRAFLIGWGIQANRSISLGLTHKIITRSLAGTSSSAIDADAGATVVRGKYRAGLVLGNVLGAKLGRDGGSDALPRTLRLGASARWLETLLTSAELATRAGVTDFRVGTEYSILRHAAIRAGWDGTGPTFGAGLRYRSLGVDYGISQHSILGLSHRLTLRMEWAGAAADKAAARAAERERIHASWTKRMKEKRDRRATERDRQIAVQENLRSAESALAAKDFESASKFAAVALRLEPGNAKAGSIADRAVLESVGRELAGVKTPMSQLLVSATAQAAVDVELAKLPGYRTKRPDAYAVIIGVERYRDLVNAEYAARDASIVREYFEKALGIPADHILLRLNERATLGDLRSSFESWLKERVTPDSEVFVFYSGHGSAKPDSGVSYLVPYDALPETIQEGGYALRRLYETLGDLPIKRALVVLDTCFSGAGGPRTVLAKGARPIVPVVEDPLLASGKIAVLAAASGSQISGIDTISRHGLLTYHMIKGIRGEADVDNDKRISVLELYTYLLPKVIVDARNAHREQEPKLLPPVNMADPWNGESLILLE